mgnify:CR=1 FL=1
MQEHTGQPMLCFEFQSLIGRSKWLCNWSNYWIAELQGVELQRLVELYAGTSQIGFIGRMYADGAPVLSESFVRVTLG